MSLKKIITLSLLHLFLSFNLYATINSVAKTEAALNQFSTIATDYENGLFDYSPELGLFLGKSTIAQDKFTDYSFKAYTQWQEQEDRFLHALNKLDKKALSVTPVYSTYLLLQETLENRKASRICKEELWDVNPTAGWHNTMVAVAQRQPVGTPLNRQLALKRWQTFNKVVESQIDNLKMGAALGYTAPKPAVKRVLTQLKMILDSQIETSPFFEFAKRDGDPIFKTQIQQLIETVINPSLNAYIHYLEYDYLPLARDEIGVSNFPSREQCYLAKLKQETTLPKTAIEIHTLGLQYMQKLAKEIAEIGLKQYGTTNMSEIFQLAQNDPNHYFSSEKELLDYNVAALNKAKSKLSSWFTTIPKADGIIKPYPAYRAQTGASGEYFSPNEDGTEPGIFYINTDAPHKSNRIDKEATLFHELIPGHHFQIALTYENKSLPSINKYLWNAGFGEGWALYVERLADEMGLYQDDLSRLGMLSNEALRAARLIVDTGIHAMGWNREQAILFLSEHTALNKNIIEGEVDRYIMMPGQATAYMIGKCEIERLRDLAKDQLGDRFSIQAFHEQILKNGMVSLPLLREHIQTWLKTFPKRVV